MFVSISQVIGCEYFLQNILDYVCFVAIGLVMQSYTNIHLRNELQCVG